LLFPRYECAIFECMLLRKFQAVFWVFCILLLGCKDTPSQAQEQEEEIPTSVVRYAKSFHVLHFDEYSTIQVTKPWPGAQKDYNYLVVPKEKLAAMSIPKGKYDAVITTPIERIVATSTTHIPALESLEGLTKLVGFPNTDYISSMPARALISQGKIEDLGNNEKLNTEKVLELQPNLIIGFAVDQENTSYQAFMQAGIPVIYNGDWTEESPLGKAEWIKFFGVLLNKQEEAGQLFKEIESAYLETKELAKNTTTKPTVISGALYKDVWYMPAGESWAAQFIKDAHAHYLYQDTAGTGSLSLSLESVLEKGVSAEAWIAPSQYTSYAEMQQANEHYQQFKAFKNQHVFTFAGTKGAKGGLLYYELAPQRPDLVLKDLVHFLHPEVLPEHTPYFFSPLQ